MNPRRQTMTVLAASSLLALTAPLQAQAVDTTYVALGDSFSAGWAPTPRPTPAIARPTATRC